MKRIKIFTALLSTLSFILILSSTVFAQNNAQQNLSIYGPGVELQLLELVKTATPGEVVSADGNTVFVVEPVETVTSRNGRFFHTAQVSVFYNPPTLPRVHVADMNLSAEGTTNGHLVAVTAVFRHVTWSRGGSNFRITGHSLQNQNTSMVRLTINVNYTTPINPRSVNASHVSHVTASGIMTTN